MKKIDSHAHYITPSYRTLFAKNHNGTLPEWDIEIQLAMNKQNEIAYSLLGIATPYFNADNMQETNRAVIESNNEIAAMTKAYDKELGFLAALPIPDIRLSLSEIDRAVQLGAKGFTFDTNMNGVYLGDPILDPLMKRLNTLHAIVAFHPTKPTEVPSGVLDDFRIQAIEFFYDTTRAFINMSRNRVFADYPDIKWIVPHAGALVPVLSDRVQSSFKMEGKGADLYADLKRVYFDITGSVEAKLLSVLKLVAPVEHFLYGSDFPYATASDVQKYRIMLEQSDKLTEPEKELVFYQNGAALLNLA